MLPSTYRDAEIPLLTSPARPPVSAFPAVGHSRRHAEEARPYRGLSAENSETHMGQDRQNSVGKSVSKQELPVPVTLFRERGTPVSRRALPSQIRAERLHYTLI